MIAGVKAWLAVLSTLLTLLSRSARAAEDANSAARELARRSVNLAGRGEPFSATWRNLSALPSGEFTQVRAAFEAAAREAGSRVSEIAPVLEARLTLSENQAEFLLVEEVRKGEERQVWMATWKRGPSRPTGGATLTLEKKLVWEQGEQILNLAFVDDGLLVLSPSGLRLQTKGSSQTAPLPAGKPWPRDLRGHLTTEGARFKAYLPGMACTGETIPALTLDCRASEEAWPLEHPAIGLLATFVAGRNYFDGRITLPGGVRKTIPPFFSAAKVSENGRTYWFLAMLDRRTQIVDANFEPAGSIAPWGSDVAAIEARCGGGSQVLATKAGDLGETDTLRGFGLVNRTPVPLSAPLDLPGPVTALWTLGGGSALAVVHDLATGRYEAFVITGNCGG